MSWFPFLIYSFFPSFVHSLVCLFVHSFIRPFLPRSKWLCANPSLLRGEKYLTQAFGWQMSIDPSRLYCLWAMKHLKSSHCPSMWHFPPPLIFSFITSEIKMLRPFPCRPHSCNQDVLALESSEKSQPWKHCGWQVWVYWRVTETSVVLNSNFGS